MSKRQTKTRVKKIRAPNKIANGFFQVPRYLVRSKLFRELPNACKVFFCHCLDIRNELNLCNPRPQGAFFYTDEAFMQDLIMNRQSVRRARRRLIDDLFLCVELGKHTGSASTYIILDECSQDTGECNLPF